MLDLLRPHKETLRKLMRAKFCRTRKKIFELAITVDEITALLETKTIESRQGSTQLGIRDCDLAKTIGLSVQRWSYVKKLLLKPPAPSQREMQSKLRK